MGDIRITKLKKKGGGHHPHRVIRLALAKQVYQNIKPACLQQHLTVQIVQSKSQKKRNR